MLQEQLVRKPAGDDLYRAIRDAIESGELQPGDRLAGLRELRKRFGIGYRTAWRQVERLEAEGYVVRRRGAGTYVRTPPPEMRRLPGTALRVQVILTIPEESQRFLRPLVEGVEEEHRRLLGGDCVPVEASPEEARALMEKRLADVFIWVYPDMPQRPVPPPAPAVLAAQDAEVTCAAHQGYDVVAADSRQGGAAAGDYLRSVGCERVVIVGSKTRDPREVGQCARLRRIGFEVGWGRPVPESDIIVAEGYTPMCGVEVTPAILSRQPRPDGVFATSDELAEGVCHALVAHGLTPGRDIKVVGFDGQPRRFSRNLVLTTVEVPMRELGREAVRMAIRRAEEPAAPARRLNLACRLRMGDSA